MPIPIPKKEPRDDSGVNVPDNGSNSSPQRVSRPIPRVSKPSRVSNPYDTVEDENVFTTDSNSYAEPYEDLSTPRGRPAPNPFANSGDSNPRQNTNNRTQRSEHNDYEDSNARFEDLEQNRNSNNIVNNDYDDYDDEYDEEFNQQKLLEEEERRKEKELYDSYDISQDEVEESSNHRKAKNSRGKKRRTRKNKKDNTGQDVFVDEEDLTLEPFGKRKVKVGEFDNRENKQKKATYVRIFVIFLILVLIGLGLKNAFMPPKSLSENEVAAISMQTVGITDFPEERGEAFAEDFMKAYLTLGGQDKASEALSFFYTGIVKPDFGNDLTQGTISNNENSNVTISGTYNQEIIIGPRTYESYSINENSAYYVVGALVQPNTPVELDERGRPPALDGDEAKWVFFSVNVYYDGGKDTMYISTDSPNLVPSMSVGSAKDIPDSMPLGTGEKATDDVIVEIKPVINGYIQGFADSSIEDYSSVEQYLSADADDTAKNGLDKEFKLSASIENAIKFTPYTVSGNENQLKVDVKVDWMNSINKESSTDVLASITYSSNYVATLVKAADGKWEVQKFDAVKYVPEAE